MSNEKIVAWVSRHAPLPAQKRVLRDKLGDIKIIQIPAKSENANELYQRLKAAGAQYAVVVLPLSITMHLLNRDESAGEITYLRAEMEQAEGQYNPDTDVLIDAGACRKRHVRFVEFRKLTAVEVRTEPFDAAEQR